GSYTNISDTTGEPSSLAHASEDDESDGLETASEASNSYQSSVHTTSQEAHEPEDDLQGFIDYAADKLFDQLTIGHHGCTPEEHTEAHISHVNDVAAQRSTHVPPGEALADEGFPDVLSQPDFLQPTDVGASSIPSSRKWSRLFSGFKPPRTSTHRAQRPKHVCLHAEETIGVNADVAFDIDSYLGFASCLSFATQGIEYQPSAQNRQNIQTDVHLDGTRYGADDEDDPDAAIRARKSALRDIPHYLLGRVTGAPDVSVFIVFPHLQCFGTEEDQTAEESSTGANSTNRFNGITTEQLRRWTDNIFNPAIQEAFDSHYSQHFTSSYTHAKANACARQTETRVTSEKGYLTEQSVAYHLQPYALERIWQDVLDTIASSDHLHDFRDPQLFFTAKGTKLRWKTNEKQRTLAAVIENFIDNITK
ncbi:hypothetical protein M409DRAFT_61796, partial [Zasmidium cellare ATCC 36951]